MEHQKKLEELNKQSLEKYEEYLNAKGEIGQEHKDKLHAAKEDWQIAWNKFMEILLVMERLEI